MDNFKIINTFCSSCGKKENFRDDYNSSLVIVDKNNRKYFLCYECNCRNFYSFSIRRFYSKKWQNIIKGNIKNIHIDAFNNWCMSEIECGYTVWKAEKASKIIQRTFLKYINRKKNLRLFYLLTNKVIENDKLPYLPPEMYTMISKFI